MKHEYRANPRNEFAVKDLMGFLIRDGKGAAGCGSTCKY
jgi:hypothetical protein